MLSVHAVLKRGAFALDARFEAPLDGVTALFGPSGAGKSLLLAAIAGLVRIEHGEIAMNGRTLVGPGVRAPAHQRGVGLVFQDSRLFPHLSVRGNLTFAVRRAPPGRTLLTIESAADLFDFAPLLDRPVRNLSGGERSRVALARALLSAPDFLLLDEPFAALDGARRHAFLDLLRDLHRRFAVPMLVVTHQVDDVARIASHLIALKSGAVAAAGPIGPTSASAPFQALLSARDSGVALPLAALHGKAGALGAAWVRADAVLVANTAPAGLSARNVWPGHISSMHAEPSGQMLRIETELGPVLARITLEAVKDLELSEGSRVWAILKTHSV